MVSAEMKFITVNPTWNVPPSIIENEYLPALQQDPQALDRIGLKLTQDADGTIHISQPPGAGNALAASASTSKRAAVEPEATLPTREDTQAFGARLGRLLRAGDLIVLTGDLGAGKTT